MTSSHSIHYSPATLAPQLSGLHLWYLDFSQLDQHSIDYCQPLLSDDEQDRARRYLRGQREFIVCRAFIRLCLARYTGEDPRALRFEKSIAGKPYLTDTHAHWQFNLSHTNQGAALAILQGASIGVDIEQPRKRNYLGIAAEYFHPEELAYLQALPEAQLAEEFFKLWTLKEAFFKALGSGIATGLHRAHFSWREKKLQHQFAEDLGEIEKEWQFHQQIAQLPQPTHIALAYRAAEAQVHWFDGGELLRDLVSI